MSTIKHRFIKGIILAPDTVALDNLEGEIKVDSSDGKIKVYLKDGVNPSAAREIVTNSQTQTLTNKTIDVDNNTISNIETDNLKAGVLNTSTTLSSASDTQLPSALAVKTYVDNSIATKDQASEISYSNATSGLTATNVQDAVDEVDGNVDNLVTLSGVALDSTNLGTFTGTTIPDNQTNKQAFQALETAHESHTGASTDVHGIGVGNSVVGTDTSQTLKNKTIDADLNTISNIDNADIKVGAAISRSKLASGTANRVVVNDGSGVQTDAAAITASRALVSDANGIPTHSATTSTELGYVSGVTSAIQTQLNSKVNASGGTLTNGSIVTPSRLDVKQDTFANLQTYAATASNGQLVFATDLKQTYQIIDGALKVVGGAGGINYISNSDFESGTTGYVTYADAAGLAPVDGTGGTANTTFTATAVSPLRGTKSGLITKNSGASRQGEGVSYNFTIDAADQAQILRISFDYSTSANYADGEIRIYVYDVTNSRLIEVIDRDLLASAQGKFVGTFQTSPDSLSYRLILHIADTDTLQSWTVEVDNVIVGPQTIVKGPIVTDWESDDSVVTFSNVTGVLTSFKKRIGDTLSIKGTLTLSSAPAGVMQLVLASGYSLDFTKINSNIPMGTISFRKNSVPSETYLGFFSPIAASNSFNLLTSRDTVNAGTSYISNNAAVTTTTPFTWASGDLIRFEISDIPIQGWSSNVVLSEDAGNREIVARYNTSSTAVANTGQTIINFSTKDFDSTSSVTTGASWSYLVPESGYYDVSAKIRFSDSSSWLAGTRLALYVFKNGVQYADLAWHEVASGDNILSFYSLNGSTIVVANKGDTLDIRSAQTTATATIALDSNSTENYVSIAKRSSPQTIAASEIVHLHVTEDATGQSIPTASAQTLQYPNVFVDTHGAYNGAGTWTCPQSGYYRVQSQVTFAPTTWNLGNDIILSINIGGSVFFRKIYGAFTSASNIYLPIDIDAVYYISKGEAVYFTIQHNFGSNKSLYNSGDDCFTTITKVR